MFILVATYCSTSYCYYYFFVVEVLLKHDSNCIRVFNSINVNFKFRSLQVLTIKNGDANGFLFGAQGAKGYISCRDASLTSD